ncbi:peptide-methionine (S)-S-oxide reductase MsrA [Portibacter lacus]|uniref:Peptide methionine sulfoxide reductase MsrA n=1 Tax=Portibacter lacus TaxID=1099794 RepID=A0AA37WHP7_9BACT|nr:peptide-methionine (S)-S-oxide reductase MsrA [Portibacter lacus]GLR19679.1 peptide methionine sulfoxide reductase MsrA [Portibacter lacus]
MEKAILAGGCFWCTEAVFQDIKGVDQVISGYIDGHVKNPGYREVCAGTTGHTEAIEITFDPEVISFEELLEIFWTTHDPTTLNRQGNDVGTQYRSGIYYLNADQKSIAEKSKSEVATAIWDDPIVTEVKEATTFYTAEPYHQNYYKRNSHVGYCAVVIGPKVAKARNKFAHKIKAS